MRIAGIVLLVIGLILLIYGITASRSLGSEISEFFTGTPTSTAVWLMIGGAVGLVLGIIFTALPARRTGGLP